MCTLHILYTFKHRDGHQCMFGLKGDIYAIYEQCFILIISFYFIVSLLAVISFYNAHNDASTEALITQRRSVIMFSSWFSK